MISIPHSCPEAGNAASDPSGDRRRAWAEVDLGRFRKNLLALRTFTGAGVKTMAVVKADAYGHGAVAVARVAEAAGVDAFGVAIVGEGLALREAGITLPVLVLGGLLPGEEESAVRARLTPAIYNLSALQRLSKSALHLGQQISYHLKVDTGMGRLGLEPDEVIPFLAQAQGLGGVEIEGVFTHFSSADEDDDTYTRTQVQRFQQVLASIDEAGIAIAVRHAANSAGTLFHPDGWLDMVRPGLILHGVNPNGGQPPVDTEPVLSFKARIALVKSVARATPLGYNRSFVTEGESVIASIPVGYGDGLNRLLSNRGRVIVKGSYAPMVGRISMDWTMIDVTGISGVVPGDEVTLVGRSGELFIAAAEVAEAAQTIPHEFLCQIGKRVPRVYVDVEQEDE